MGGSEHLPCDWARKKTLGKFMKFERHLRRYPGGKDHLVYLRWQIFINMLRRKDRDARER